MGIKDDVFFLFREVILGRLKECRPHPFKAAAEEVSHGHLMLRLVAPQRVGPELKREGAAMKHDDDYVH